MKCPFCGFLESRVIDSRPADDSQKIRRRRECLGCNKRFTTYEIIEMFTLVVIKKDKSREEFDRNKLINGLRRACEKRPISMDTLEKVAYEIEMELYNSLDKEIPSQKIGELCMRRLKELDDVAYVRFASVYRQFADLDSFLNELERIKTGD